MTEWPLTIDRPLWTASCPASRTYDTSSPSDPHLTSLIATSLRQVEASSDDAAAILPECYYSEPFFRHELASVFGRSWICVGRASQLDDHHEYIDYRIADRQVLVVRGESGSIEAVSPVCRHRAAIAEVRAGPQGTKIVCPYHKWTYGPDGALLNAPLMPMSKRQRARFGLRRFRCEIWLGWVFVSFDDHAPALSDHLTEVERQLHPWRIDAMVPIGAPIVYQCAFNWKIACDNQGESYHLVGSHAKSVLPYVDPSASRFMTDGRSYVRSWFPAIGGPMGPAFGSRLEGVRSDFNGTWSYNVFPNHMFVVSDDFVVWQQQVIVDHGRCRHMLQVLGFVCIHRSQIMAHAR